MIREAEPRPGLPGRISTMKVEQIVVEAIGMRPDPPRRRLLESEGEGVEHLRSCQTRRTCCARTWMSTPKCSCVTVADAAVGAVGGDHQIIIRPVGQVGAGFMHRSRSASPRRASRARSVQNVEQAPAADADETVTRRDGSSRRECGRRYRPNARTRRAIISPPTRGRSRIEILDRLVGEDHAPAEGHALGIALDDLDLVRRVAQLHRDGEGQPRGPPRRRP